VPPLCRAAQAETVATMRRRPMSFCTAQSYRKAAVTRCIGSFG
jgi:hypothetical protein